MFVLSLFLFLFYLSVFKFQFMEKNWTSPFAWCSALQLIRLKFPAQSMFSFLHRPSVLLHKTSIYCQEQWVLILCCIYILFGLSCVGSHWLALYWITENHGFSLVYGTRVNKLTANVNFLGKYSITTNWSVLNMAFQALLYHETGAGTPLLCVWILGCMLVSHYIITLDTFVLCGNIPDSFCISLHFFWYRNHQKDTLMSIEANIEEAASLTSQHVLVCLPQPT